ncbi:hypothetical protein HDV00_003956 [Rhizophlyctis rosea]|nr:hypothetical protein HDV00_003956 [Rhizophlyctis rosea]
MQFKSFAAVVAFGVIGVNADGIWSRRIYYDNLGCSPNNYAYAVSVFTPGVSCAGKTTAQESLLVSCIPKSSDTRAASSEGSGCDNISGTVSDAEWAVPNGQGSKIPGAPYLVTNTYGNAQGCSISSSTNSITQTIYAADQKCHAYEPNVFFKAACNNDGGVVMWCSDSACTQCGKDGTMSEGVPGIVKFFSNCSGTENGAPSRSICSGGGNAALPNWSPSNTASTSVSSQPAAASPTASSNGTSSGNTTTPSSNKSSATKEGVAVGALFAAVVAAVAI